MSPTTCMQCGAEMHSAIENYRGRADEFGLDVVLCGIEVRRCPECGEDEIVIPQMDDLMRVLTHAVAKKPSRLLPTEVRFLRKSLGWSGRELADRMAVDKATVSRWETGAQPMSTTAERFLRVLALTDEPITDYSMLEQMGTEEAVGVDLFRLSHDNGWHVSA